MKRMWILMVVAACPLLALGSPQEQPRSRAGAVPAGRAGALDRQRLRRLGGLHGRRDRRRVGHERHGQRDQRQGRLQPLHLGGRRQHDPGPEERDREPAAVDQHLLRHAGHEQGRPRGRARAQPDHGATREDGPARACPSRSNTSQMDPVTGALNWPSALQDTEFRAAARRAGPALRQAGHVRRPRLCRPDARSARRSTPCSTQLKAQIREIPPPDYVACRSFLRSLIYAAIENRSVITTSIR